MSEHKITRKKMKLEERHDGDDDSRLEPIPNDLILEILSRLPAKSILRYRCLSKLWYSLTKLPSFINLFMARSSSRPPTLMLTFLQKEKKFVFLLPQNRNIDGSYAPDRFYQMTNPHGLGLVRSKSVNGLVLYDEFKIWNTTMRRYLSLQYPKTCDGISIVNDGRPIGLSLLGYDPLECKHKVLYIDPNHAQILTLGVDESWRVITQSILPHSSLVGIGECINGVLYYKGWFRNPYGGYSRIMSFDVRTEKFNPIKTPDFTNFYHMISYEGSLAIVNHGFPLYKIDLYIMIDDVGHEWDYKEFHVPLRTDQSSWNLCFKGVTDSGELIFTPGFLYQSVYILYFDMKRNIIREAWFNGIVSDEFRVLHGLGNKCIGRFEMFPDCMERLLFL